MQTIHKFLIEHGNSCYMLSMPKDAQVLSVGIFEGKIAVWAIVDTDKPMIRHNFMVCETGKQLQDNQTKYIFIGTVDLSGQGYYINHVFYQIRP